MTTSPPNGNTINEPVPGFGTDFVDFYALLEQPRNAATVQLRSRLNELYAEAQANRDHRNPEKRANYARLLQWIPTARSVLLHEERRARYDEYSTQRLTGASEQEFYDFLQALLGENEFSFSDGESIPAIRQANTAPRPLPSLDAVREATQQSVVLNTTAVTASNGNSQTANVTVAPVSFPVTDKDSEPQAAPKKVTQSDRRKKTPSAVPLHPSVQRERALLLSSAMGGFTFFTLLLGLRVLLGTSFSLVIIVAIATLGGGILWRIANRAMLSRIKRSS